MIILITTISVSCAGLKHIPEGDSLYTGMHLKIKKEKSCGKFKIESAPAKIGSAYKEVWDVPNGGLFGTPFLRIGSSRLFLHNVFRTDKEKGFKYWMQNNFGEEPVLMSKIQPDVKCRLLEKSFTDRGHFGTQAHYELKKKRKGKKTKVKYVVKVHPSYHYNSITQINLTQNLAIDSVFRDFRLKSSQLHKGDEFSIAKLEEERLLSWEHLQNSGFFYVSPEDILFEADTTIGNRKIDLHLFINPELSEIQLNRATISEIKVQLDSIDINLMSRDQFFPFSKGKMNYKFLNKLIAIDSNSFFSRERTLLASRLLNQAAIFRGYSINYVPTPTDSSQLTSYLSLEAKKATHFGVRINANYKSIGYIGPSIEFSLRQLNIKGKGRNLTTKLDLYYDEPVGIYRQKVSSALASVSIVPTHTYPQTKFLILIKRKAIYLNL